VVEAGSTVEVEVGPTAVVVEAGSTAAVVAEAAFTGVEVASAEAAFAVAVVFLAAAFREAGFAEAGALIVACIGARRADRSWPVHPADPAVMGTARTVIRETEVRVGLVQMV
jgi:hypothetical protein